MFKVPAGAPGKENKLSLFSKNTTLALVIKDLKATRSEQVSGSPFNVYRSIASANKRLYTLIKLTLFLNFANFLRCLLVSPLLR